jgi:hypothetical protein
MSTQYPLIISFYTQDWEYPKLADSLRQNCEDLGLKHHIKEVSSTGDYVKNTSLKSQFIYETLTDVKEPVLWIDCDGSLLDLPALLDRPLVDHYDMAARRHLRTGFRTWGVGTLWFNYSTTAVDFVSAWRNMVGEGTDEHAFEETWKQHCDLLKVYELPDSYFHLLYKEWDQAPPGTVIAHRLSKSPDKMRRKYPNDPQWTGDQS